MTESRLSERASERPTLTSRNSGLQLVLMLVSRGVRVEDCVTGGKFLPLVLRLKLPKVKGQFVIGVREASHDKKQVDLALCLQPPFQNDVQFNSHLSFTHTSRTLISQRRIGQFNGRRCLNAAIWEKKHFISSNYIMFGCITLLSVTKCCWTLDVM